jgi:CBS domain-containing protein
MRNEPIVRIMTESPATVAPGDSLAKARRLFESSNVHHLPVVDDGALVGILSANDFLKLHLLKNSKAPVDKASVRQLMHADPVAVPGNASLRDASEHLLDGGFHALPVVDADGSVIGIITTSDLVQYLLHHVPRDDGSVVDDASGAQDLVAQNRRLKAVSAAAEHYIRSGHADHEHSVLVKRLDELRRLDAIRL